MCSATIATIFKLIFIWFIFVKSIPSSLSLNPKTIRNQNAFYSMLQWETTSFWLDVEILSLKMTATGIALSPLWFNQLMVCFQHCFQFCEYKIWLKTHIFSAMCGFHINARHQLSWFRIKSKINISSKVNNVVPWKMCDAIYLKTTLTSPSSLFHSGSLFSLGLIDIKSCYLKTGPSRIYLLWFCMPIPDISRISSCIRDQFSWWPDVQSWIF